MKIDKQSNVYIVIYIVVLVVIVGAALAFTSMRLRPMQEANMDADKMRQILASVRIVPAEGDILADFDRFVVRSFVVDASGREVADAPDAFDVDVEKEAKHPAADRLLPVYEVRLSDGALKYVLPAYGAGLWGPIWGYVSVDADGSTIFGAYFSHQSETPGLGAEIARPAFSGQFVGKSLFRSGSFIPVDVVKKGMKPSRAGADYVDAVSGGTITSKGVAAMLDNCLRPYENFLSALGKPKN